MKIPIQINKVDDRRLTITHGFFHGEYNDLKFNVRIDKLGTHVFLTATDKVSGEIIEEQFDLAQLVKEWLITKKAELESQS
jgi:hypothetical protein